jgi:hypothetical protein
MGAMGRLFLLLYILQATPSHSIAALHGSTPTSIACCRNTPQPQSCISMKTLPLMITGTHFSLSKAARLGCFFKNAFICFYLFSLINHHYRHRHRHHHHHHHHHICLAYL